MGSRWLVCILLAASCMAACGGAAGGYEEMVKEAERADVVRQAQFAHNVEKQHKEVQREERLAMQIQEADSKKSSAAEKDAKERTAKAESKAQSTADSVLASRSARLSEEHPPSNGVQKDVQKQKEAKVADVKHEAKEVKHEAKEAYQSYQQDVERAAAADKKRQQLFETQRHKEIEKVKAEHWAHEEALDKGTAKRKAWQVALAEEAQKESERKKEWLEAFKKAKSRLERADEAKDGGTHAAQASGGDAAKLGSAGSSHGGGDSRAARISAGDEAVDTVTEAPHAAAKHEAHGRLESHVPAAAHPAAGGTSPRKATAPGQAETGAAAKPEKVGVGKEQQLLATQAGATTVDRMVPIAQQAKQLSALPQRIAEAREEARKTMREADAMEARKEGESKLEAAKKEFLKADNRATRLKMKLDKVANERSGPAWASILEKHHSQEAAGIETELAVARREVDVKRKALAGALSTQFQGQGH